jgi:hypothetical protein
MPIAVAMTFGVVYMRGADLQPVSVATPIIALELSVDVMGIERIITIVTVVRSVLHLVERGRDLC